MDSEIEERGIQLGLVRRAPNPVVCARIAHSVPEGSGGMLHQENLEM